LLGRGLASTGPVVIPVTQPEFGAVRVSTQSLGSFVVSNGGGAPLNISSATIGGANAADFSVVTDACTGTPLAPAGTCEIQVQFAPLALGARVATLTLESDDPEGPKVLPLTGVGTSPLLTLDAAALDFGQQRIGTSGRRTLTLTNTGTGPLNILQLGTIGGDAGDFSVAATTCSSTLAQGASCSLELSFRPTAVGARSSLLQIVTDAPTSPDVVELTGEGLEGEPGGGDICIER
ncbi:MAG: choice-of-anchor D domain-containing protein, partial [Myxococcaceae bacterium]